MLLFVSSSSFVVPSAYRCSFTTDHYRWSFDVLPRVHVQSIWRHKGSTLGMQGLERAEGAEKSQGHKALGIRRPCLCPVRAQRRDLLSFTLGQQGFEIHPRAARVIAFEYFGSGLGSGKAKARVSSNARETFVLCFVASGVEPRSRPRALA